jgi:hypothetical protein
MNRYDLDQTKIQKNGWRLMSRYGFDLWKNISVWHAINCQT